MSTPPPNYPPPPGPAYYGGPPPPQQNSGNGCLKAAGITCGVLLVIVILGGIWMTVAVKNALKNPNNPVGQVLQQSMAVVQASKDGQSIQRAIVQYKTAKGSYPSSLSSLVPSYLPDNAALHSSLDPDSSPDHITWQYTQPSTDADPNTVILKLPYKMTVTVGGQTQSTPGSISVSLNGNVQSQSPNQYSPNNNFRSMPSQ